jgi:outer membrane protein OmpA-like peptidoglycan-associated protein
LATLKHILFIAGCIFFTSLCIAQTKTGITPSNADCLKAIELKDTVFGPTAPPEKFGTQLEVSGNDKKSLYYIEEEHHTVWYTFKCPCSGQLTFDIIPESKDDDYDFLLFKFAAGADYCGKIARKEIKPIRSNIARNNKATKSKTGLSVAAKDSFVHSGPGAGYSKFVDVRKDQRYYLLVDNVYTGGKGHTIKLHYKCGAAASTPPVKSVTKPTVTITKNDTITKIDLTKLDVGSTLALKTINFYPDETRMLPESVPELKNLLKVMQDNPKLKIEIGGHVDGPMMMHSKYYQKLSDDRAKTIFTYLVNNKIDGSRLRWKGYSNTQKIFEYPKDESESKTNRRVEIKILEK